MSDKMRYILKISNTVAVLCLILCAHLGAASLREPIAWQNNLEQAIQQSKSTGKPLYIHFYGDNCPPCKLMDRDVFTDQAVIATVNRDFVPVKIHAGRQQVLAEKFEIKAIPTDIVLLSNGQLLHRRQGGISKERFVEYTAYLAELQRKQAVQTPRQTPQQPPAPVGAPGVVAPTEATQGNSLRDPFTKQVVVSPAEPQAATPSALPIPSPVPAMAAPTSALPPTLAQNAPSAFMATPAPAVAAQQTLAFKNTSPHISIQNSAAPSNTNMATNDSPKTTVEVPLGLEGYCPVVLGKEEKWVPGNPAYYAMFRGHVFRFSSEEAMTEFAQSPLKFAPIAMGEDIVQMVDRNKKVYGNRKFGVWFQGRVFLFENQTTLDLFAQRPEYYSEIAIQYETAFKGVNGLF